MTGKIDIDTIKKITATMGPISIYQFGEFSKYGVNALRLFQYIKQFKDCRSFRTLNMNIGLRLGM